MRGRAIRGTRTILDCLNTLQSVYVCGHLVDVEKIAGLDQAAELFKVLGNESRLALVWLLSHEPLTVGALADQAGLSQPLVSQHLRTLRQAGLVNSEREGKEIRYALADEHVAHVVLDAIAHVQEPNHQGSEQ